MPAKKRRARLKSGEGKKEHLNIRIRASDKVLLDAICDFWGWSQSAVIVHLISDRYRTLSVESEEFAKLAESKAHRNHR